MADEAPPKPEAAKSAAPVQEGAVGAASEAQMDQGLEEAQIDQTEGVPDKDPDVDVGTRLAQLFDHLKIAKVVFVDDKAELQTDAGTIYKVVVETPGASEALAAFFPGVGLTIDNEALLDQLDVRLAQLDADGSEALRAALASLGGDAAEREAGGLLKDALPEAVATTLLTPQLWHERRAELIAECTDDRRTLFLFDQELEVQDGSLGFTKGSEIIRDMAEKDKAGFGSRWFCGILTHTVSKGDEVSSWRGLAQAENLGLELFMPIAKATLDDAPAFCAAVYRTLINTYCETMKSLAQEAFSSALKEALERFADLDPIDFEHMVIKSSEEEGVSELATLIRLYGIIHTDQVKAKILQKAHVNEFSAAARTANGIADIGRTLSPNSQERLHKLRHDELYESDQFVNSYHDPLRNGDVFQIGEGDGIKLWVLIAQPCDLMVRSNGKRAREDNFKVAVLAPLSTGALGAPPASKDGLTFPLDAYDHGGAQSAIVKFAEGTPANLQVLDLAVFSKEGHCHLSAKVDPDLSLPSRAWEKRDGELRSHFGKVTKQIEDARKAHKDPVAKLLAAAILPRGAPAKAFQKYGAYDKEAYSYQIRRCGRIREPLATSLLLAYSRFLARDAYEHDFSRA